MSKQAKPPPPGDKPVPTAPPKPPTWRNWIWPIMLIAIFALWFLLPTRSPSTSLSYSQFLSDVSARPGEDGPARQYSGWHEHRHADRRKELHRGRPAAGGPGAADRAAGQQACRSPSAPSGNGFGTEVLIYLITFGLPILIFVWLFRRISRSAGGGLQGALGVGRSRAKVFDEEQPSTTFADVAGYEGAKAEIAEVVDFLKHPERYTRVGAMVPRGVLMVGPPGTGKTLLARAVAGEAHVPFFSVTGSSFVELFVGVGASRVRDLFEQARKRGTAIIFIDEVDAIGQRRAGSGAVVSNDEREQTLNQLLAEMDGFDPSTGVVVLAATNRPEILDPALLRPGRFDRQVTIPLPNVGRADRDPGRALPGQEAGPGRRPQRHRPRHPRVLRRGPGQPDQRGGHRRGPGRPGHPHGRRLRRGPGPDHPGPAGRARTCCCRRRSTRWRCTSPGMRWWRRCPSTPTRWRR